ncbi:hypothetical protein E8E11_006538 [Didymella keratinophila]|nr:hypothetical protein E8E11_006538 [Didymella keratinophila]
MPPRPFVNDALWRCLCPGFPPNATAAHLARAIAPATLAPKRLSRASHQTRTYSAAAAAASQPTSFAQPHVPASTSPPRFNSRRNPKEKTPLVHLPTHVLYEDLRDAGAKGQFEEVMKIANVLIQDRGQRPDQAMYAAVLHSFASADTGTAGKVRKVLEEMGFWSDTAALNAEGKEKVDLDVRGCENVLQALAVHPDYLLRAEVLEYMREKWYTLSDRAHCFVVAGLLRDRLFEQALEMLEDMCRKKVRVDEWVWSEAMWLLLEFGEVEEAFYVLGLKESVSEGTPGAAYDVKLSNALWGAMLDAAAQQQLHDAARIVWTTQVQSGYLKPPTGTCLQVLSLASRHGDIALATDVFRILTSRETIFTTHHYELLIATYLGAGALSDALSVILIMLDANLKVDSGTCQPLFLYLRSAPPPPPQTVIDEHGEEKVEQLSMPLHAFTLLQSFEAQGRKIPTAAVNCCIQASVALGSLPEALDMYKALHTVASAGPNTETFNILFRGCSQAGRKDLAMYLANEMISLNLRPDRITYDRLVWVCAQAGDLDDAVNYFEEMRAAGMRPRRGTYEMLLNKLVDADDERCVAVLRDYKDGAEMVSPVERRIRGKFVVPGEA